MPAPLAVAPLAAATVFMWADPKMELGEAERIEACCGGVNRGGPTLNGPVGDEPAK